MKYSKSVIIIVILIILGIVVYQFTKPQNIKKDIDILLFFTDKNSMYLIPVTKKITISTSIDNPDKIEDLNSIIKNLLKDIPHKNLYSPFPENTKIVWIKKEQNNVNVKLDINGANVGSNTEELMFISIVNTLTSIPGIEKVKLNFISKTQMQMDYDQFYNRPEYLNSWYYTESLDNENVFKTATLYWKVPETNFLVPINLPVKELTPLKLLTLLQELPITVSKKSLEASVPLSWKLNVLKIKGKKIWLEIILPLNESIEQIKLSIKAIVNTLADLSIEEINFSYKPKIKNLPKKYFNLKQYDIRRLKELNIL